MENINKNAKDFVLKNYLPKEINLPHDLSLEWQRFVEDNSSYMDRIDWVDRNVLRLTFDEYAVMFDSILMTKDIEDNPEIDVEKLISGKNNYRLLHRYFVVTDMALDELERRLT